jgi:rhamnulokinase
MTARRRVAAVDLGASSGRVVVGEVGPGRLDLHIAHRFGNAPVRAADGSLRWDMTMLGREIERGLRAAGPLDSIGVDSWAVDYGLLDERGGLLGDPFCYRDERTHRGRQRVAAVVSDEELFDRTGLQQQPFNTIYQLAAEPDLDRAATMLLIPDLVAHRLTGVIGAELTNASTTQLLDVRQRTWATDLAERVGIPARLLPPLHGPGDLVGGLEKAVAERVGLPTGTPVVAVGSHDTASAVVGVPAAPGSAFGYVSSGTWSLVGVELDRPVLTPQARAANFTNEGGVDGTTRFLRNVMGLWVLSEAMRDSAGADLGELLAAAAERRPDGPVVDIDDPAFLPPGDMVGRIEAACRATGQRPPADRPAVVRCILDSLAAAYRTAIDEASRLSGQAVDVVHVVGGGAQNELLCRLAADALGRPVLAGPVEATALGNVLVQARALGADLPDLAAMRALVATTHPVRRFEPSAATRET